MSKKPTYEDLRQRITELEKESAERGRIEEALRESEEKFRLAFASSPDSVNVNRLEDGLFVDINESFTQLTGYTREDVLGKTSLEIGIWHDPADRTRLIESLQEKGGCENLEAVFRMKDGALVTGLMSARVISINKEPQILSMTRDITDRKLAEEELVRQKVHLESLFTNTNDAIVFTDTEHKIININEQFTRLFGYDLAEIKGVDINTVVDPHGVAESVYASALFLRGEKVEMEAVRYAKNGDAIDVLIRGAPVLMEGRIVGGYAIYMDIREKKRVEEALNLRNIYLEALNETTLGLMQRMDQADLCQIIGARAAQLAGADECRLWVSDPERGDLEVKAVVGSNEWMTGSRVEPGRGIHGEILRTGGTVLIDDYRVWPKRVELSCDDMSRAVIGIPLKYENRFSGILCLAYHDPARRFDDDIIDILERLAELASIALDNTRLYERIKLELLEREQAAKEQKRLQARLNQAQKMESVGRLAGGVAHDFNNMLSIILGHTDMALDYVDPAQPIHEDLLKIRKATTRSADLVRQLLAFARKQTIAPKVLDLNETVEGMLKMIRRLIGENIDLAWLPDINLWPVKMDTTQIDQILANLCVNARDAITGVGKVTIETGNVVLDENYCAQHMGFVPGEYVLLAVSDNGSGMEKEILEKLFEPFFTTKEVGKGTGLGFPTVYGIVKQNKGFINVYSEPGHGTTIRIYLPRNIGEVEEPQKPSAAKSFEGGHETVLLVEDEPLVLQMGKDVLERLGYRVLPAGMPSEAIRIAEEHKEDIHLLITDVIMPEINGRELAERLLSLQPDLKRLFMSGYTADVIANHGVLDKGVCFIQKPFSMRDLAIKIREVLEDTE